MIVTQDLRKEYGALTAVDSVSFTVGDGEVLGFLGPNGAGKSTTMKMIAGFLQPSAGRISVCGHDVVSDGLAARAVIGYLPEGAPSYEEMTPRSFLDFVADVRGLRGDTRRRRLDDVIERLHLGPVLEQSIETLSKGFKRRVGIAQAILHDPRVLILDEPTDGLDPNQKHEVRQLISDIAADKTIIISTHILEEVHAVCTRAIIIAAGRLLADDTPTALEARSRYYNAVHLRLGDGTDYDGVCQALRALNDVAKLETLPEERRVSALPRDGKAIFHAVNELVVKNDWNLVEMHSDSGRLDEVFRQITTAHGESVHG
jgi:ABC-2 type transport system ATP-binding protein